MSDVTNWQCPDCGGIISPGQYHACGGHRDEIIDRRDARIEALEAENARLREVVEAARNYELKLVDHRADLALGRLKLIPIDSMDNVTPEYIAQVNEYTRRLNDVTTAEGDLINALIAFDPAFRADFYAVTTGGKIEAKAKSAKETKPITATN